MNVDAQSAVLTVSTLTGRIRGLLERSFDAVWVQGEVSNLTRHSSGHWYFTLKDANAQLSAVMFRRQNAQVRFEPAPGMQVLAAGGISVYPPHGRYQLIVNQLEPAGVGDLHMALEALKARLEAEGLFDTARKRPLPVYPETIGIVTSPTGAAIRDMIQVMTRRFPMGRILLFPARVQGEQAAAEIREGIAYFNETKSCDVIIVGRGGGSLEDLWAFNDEILVRTIHDSQIPVVSAVGHEIDMTLSDLVADLRAPTPSAAAELVVPDQQTVLQWLQDVQQRTDRTLAKRIQHARLRLERVLASYGLRRPGLMVQTLTQSLDQTLITLQQQARYRIQNLGQEIHRMTDRLNALDPRNTLARGYALVTDSNNRVITDATQAETGMDLDIHLSHGRLRSQVKEVHREEDG